MLVEGSSWGPEDPPPARAARRPLPRLPWRPFAWLAAFLWLLWLAGTVGGLPGYGLVLLAVVLGSWRVERWCAQFDWAVGGGSGAWR